MELGAGIGLPSILAAKLGVCKRVFCTDYLASVLDLSQQNTSLNKVEGVVSTRQLDWQNIEENSLLFCAKNSESSQSSTQCTDDSHVSQRTKTSSALTRSGDSQNVISRGSSSSRSSKFVFTDDDQRTLSAADKIVLLASDIAYDDILTSAFVRSLHGMLTALAKSRRDVEVVITLEKRVNFELASLSAGSHAYDYLISQLSDAGLNFETQNLTNIPKCSRYERGADLVLMKVGL